MKRAPLLFLLALFASLHIHAGTLTSSVDRTRILSNETLPLTVQYDDSADGEEPDITALQNQFTVHGPSRSSNVQIINGHLSRSTVWYYELLPRHTGTLLIPSFSIHGDFSEAITIHVGDIPKGNSQTRANIYSETEIDHTSVHVQEQAVITWRIVSRFTLSEPALVLPQINNVLIQDLGNREYQRADSEGNLEHVIEMRYALFPQTSGTVTIPAEQIQVTVIAMQRSSMGIVHPSSTPVRINTETQQLHVLPAIDNGQKAWLPAQKLEITQDIRGLNDQGKATAGTAFTRIVKLRAEGVSAEQLPSLDLNVSGFKTYSEKPQLKDDANAQGIIGTREEHTAMIATRSGTFTLPALKLAWYNTQTATWEESTLPATTVDVLPDATDTTPAASTATPSAEIPEQTVKDENQSPSADADIASVNSNHTVRLWQGAAALLLLLWIASMAWLWRYKRKDTAVQPNIVQTTVVHKAGNSVIHTKNSRWNNASLSEALRTKNMAEINRQMLAWAKQQWPDQPPHSLTEISTRVQHPDAASALLAVEACLYGNGAPPDNLDALQTLLAEKDKPVNAKKTSPALTELYK